MRTSTWITIIGIAIAAFVIGIISGFIPIKTEPKKPTQTEQQIAELTEELAQTKQQLNELSDNYVYNTIDTISGAVTDLDGLYLFINDEGEYTLEYGIDYERVSTDGDELNYYSSYYTGHIDLNEIITPSDVAEIEENDNDNKLYIIDDYTKARIRSGLPIQVSCYDLFGEDHENEIILYLTAINGNDYYYSNSDKLNTKSNYNEVSSPVYYELIVNRDLFRISYIEKSTYTELFVHEIEFTFNDNLNHSSNNYEVYFNLKIISPYVDTIESTSDLHYVLQKGAIIANDFAEITNLNTSTIDTEHDVQFVTALNNNDLLFYVMEYQYQRMYPTFIDLSSEMFTDNVSVYRNFYS